LVCEHFDIDIEVLAGKGRAPEMMNMRVLVGFRALSELVWR